MQKGLKKIPIILLLFLWLFSGWPVIWQNPRIPQKVKTTQAASGDVILLWDTANGSVPAGWTCISCSPGDAFYGVFPRAASSYGANTAGADTHQHTLTYSSATQGNSGTAKGNNTSNKALLNTHTHTWGNITSPAGDVRPPYQNLNFISANNPSVIPANTIAIFDGNLPSGWTRYTGLDSNYLRGYSDNAAGGSATHLHTIAASAITSSNATRQITDSGSGGSACNDLSHALPVSNTNLTNDNNTPSYLEVIFAYNSSGGDTSIPTGLIAFFNASPPSGWTNVSDSSPWTNSFLKGAATYSGTGGSSANQNHGGSVSLTSDNCSASSTALGTTGTYTGSGTAHNHSITYTINSAGSLPVYRDVILAKYSAVVSVNVTSDGSISFGTIAASTTKDTTSSGLNDTQTGQNDGTGTENFNIKTSNATGGTQWTLGANPGSDVFVHEFSINAGSNWTKFTTADSYQTLATGIAASGTQNFDLKITTPSSSSDYQQKSITVTIQAVGG